MQCTKNNSIKVIDNHIKVNSFYNSNLVDIFLLKFTKQIQ